MKIYNDLIQGTPEWHAVRDFKMTASNASTIAVAGKGLETYIKKLAQEHYSTGEKSNYTNDDMRRGTELEPIARQIYEFEKDCIVDQVGFIERDKHFGCSPDGLIGTDGGWENKCPSDKTYFEYLLDENLAPDSDYIAQCQMCMLVTGREWWDLQYYNPNFKQSTKVWRIVKDPEFHTKLENGFLKGKEIINEIKNKLK